MKRNIGQEILDGLSEIITRKTKLERMANKAEKDIKNGKTQDMDEFLDDIFKTHSESWKKHRKTKWK